MIFRWSKITSLQNHHTGFYFIILLCIFPILLRLHKPLFNLPSIITTPNKTTISSTTTTSYYYSRPNNSIDNSSSVYYRHATSARNSSYPYISGDTFRAFSDYIYDETRQDNLSSIKYGDIIFVKTDMLSRFFSAPFQSIQQSFILITHNSDFYAPDRFKDYLSDSKIIKWYASNPSLNNSQKLIPIPIGLANTRWPHGNVDKFMYAFKMHRKPWLERTIFLYVNFDVGTNRIQREKALSQASKIPNVQIVKDRITFERYLEEIGNAKYVLSPPGNGLDCHRTWEGLLMGAVPIVLSSTLDPLFEKTRSIIIDDWMKLTEEFLLSFNFSLNDHILPDVIYAQYWRQRILKDIR